MSGASPLSTPVYYSLELTPVCDSHCSACSNVFERQSASLTGKSWREVLARIAPHAESIKITGGEPTLHPEFEEIIRAISELGISATVFTNARWKKPEKIIHLFSTLPSKKWGLLVSLHGPDASSHEAFTDTPGSFEETCANIKLATEAGLHVHTSTVITRQNYDRLAEVAALSKSLKARRAVFNRYLGAPLPAIEPDDEQLRQAIRDIERLYKVGENVRYGNCIPQCFAPSASTGCWAGVAYCTIDPWGNLRPCNHSPTMAGNILEEPIETIWQNEIMEHWRTLTPKQCGRCTELDVCHGGCRALVEIRQRDPLVHSPVRKAAPPIEVELYEKSRPALICKILPERFGYALIRGQALAQVSPQAKEILDYLDGQNTLGELKIRFGQDTLDFVGALYLKGLLTLEV